MCELKGTKKVRAHGMKALPRRVDRFLKLVELNAPETLLYNEMRLISWAFGCIMGAEDLPSAKPFRVPSAAEDDPKELDYVNKG